MYFKGFNFDDSASMHYKVEKGTNVATLVFKRADGHELSLSSYQKMLCEFNEAGEAVNDHGSYTGARQFVSALLEFLSVGPQEDAL